VREHVPPFLLLHATADPDVPFSQVDRFAGELHARGYVAEVFVAEDARHAFARTSEWRAPTLTALNSFFRRFLGDTIYHAGWYDSRPVWSPDGSHIAFQSNYGGEKAIWLMRSDGSQLRRVASGSEASWSPAGALLAFASGEGRLAAVRMDGSEFRLLTQDTTEFVYAVSWSPDGAHIAFSNWADNQLHVLTVATGHSKPLTDTPGGSGSRTARDHLQVGEARQFPDAVRNDLEAYAGCVSGAAPIADTETMLAAAGFVDIRVELKGNSAAVVESWSPGAETLVASALIRARKRKPERSVGAGDVECQACR
jgi:dipeptidyl aminopeptidase/acylaminoacyl peptidase